MQTNLVVLVANRGAIFGERFESVTGDEPRCFDAVLVEELEQTLHSDRAGKEACIKARLDDASIALAPGLKIPLLMSLVESSPPYEPSQPATASMSTPNLRSASGIFTTAIACWKPTVADQNPLLAHNVLLKFRNVLLRLERWEEHECKSGQLLTYKR